MMYTVDHIRLGKCVCRIKVMFQMCINILSSDRLTWIPCGVLTNYSYLGVMRSIHRTKVYCNNYIMRNKLKNASKISKSYNYRICYI